MSRRCRLHGKVRLEAYMKQEPGADSWVCLTDNQVFVSVVCVTNIIKSLMLLFFSGSLSHTLSLSPFPPSQTTTPFSLSFYARMLFVCKCVHMQVQFT